jgi:hypothetical protein
MYVMAAGGGTGKYPLVDALGGFSVLIGEQPFICDEAGEKVCGSQLAVAGFGTSLVKFGASGLNLNLKLSREAYRRLKTAST